ncbi:MAG: restriction endonuclease subunit S [Gallionellales bacterium GWA2_59_43]|nr:MAG: restriction endonuclease subunit S [Gallionellales bacterium GWA2_59_43]
MSNFAKGKIGDLLTLQRGFDITKKQQTNGIYPVVSSSGVTSYHSEFMAKGPGVVIGRKGTLGSAFYLETDYWPHDTTLWVKDFKGNDPKFIYYFLKTLRLERLDSGSSNPTLNRNFVHQLDANKPDPKVQRKIAAVLSALDAKINCNNRINAELEALAKTLYDYWFVQFDFPFDFAQGRPDANGDPYKSSGGKMVYNATLKREIPAGWKDSNILAVADLLGGGTPTKKKPEYWSGDIPFFTPTDADGTIFKFSTADYITDAGLKGSSTKLFGTHTVFITARGSVGRLVLAGVDMAMNQSCYALRAKPGISYTYLFFLAKELIHHLQVKSSGSVFDSIVSNDIELTNLAIPKSEVIEKFAAVVEPAFEKIANNTKENQHLTQLRDWLLPMLMNGQVTVA